jgi:hypothetical protein
MILVRAANLNTIEEVAAHFRKNVRWLLATIGDTILDETVAASRSPCLIPTANQ